MFNRGYDRIFCQLQRRNIARRSCGDYERMIEARVEDAAVGGGCFLRAMRYNAQCCSGRSHWTRVLARIRGNKRRHCVFERLTRCQGEPVHAYAKQRRC